MSDLNINVAGGRKAFQPGEPVEVEVSWRLDEPAQRVELRLIWYTEGKGVRDWEIVWSESFEQPALSDSRVCHVQLPTSPYSFSGRVVSLLWAFELVVLPVDDSIREDIVIAPEAREVVLHGDSP